MAEAQPGGPSTGSCNNIGVDNGHIWDSPTTEVEEHLGSSGTAEWLQITGPSSGWRVMAEQDFSEGSSRVPLVLVRDDQREAARGTTASPDPQSFLKPVIPQTSHSSSQLFLRDVVENFAGHRSVSKILWSLIPINITQDVIKPTIVWSFHNLDFRWSP